MVITMFYQVKDVQLTKNWIILLLLSCCTVALAQQTDVLDQPIDVHWSGQTSLQNAINDIASSSEVSFTYSPDLINIQQPVDPIDTICQLKSLLQMLLPPRGINFNLIAGTIVLQPNTIRDRLTFSGKIVDANNSAPLAFCTISLQGKYIGTISNIDGEFDFHLKTMDLNDTIVVSMMGYKTWKCPIGAFDLSGQLIRLEQSEILLNDLELVDRAPPADGLMQQVRKRLKKNYPTRPTTLDGFYRNHFKINEKYVSLLEAAVVIEGGSIRKQPDKDHVFIRAIRSNKGLQKTNSLFRESNENLLRTLLYNDLLRKKDRHSGILNPNNKYVITSITTFKDRPVYVLENRDFQSYYELSTTPYIKAALTLFVDAETFGIVRIELISDFDQGNQPWQLGGSDEQLYDMVYSKFIQEYREIDGKLHLNYFSSHFKFDVLHPQTNKIKNREELVRELFINDIKLRRQREFNWHEEIPDAINLENATINYNQSFWTRYNAIKSSPLTRRIIADLEQMGKLENQFIQ
ncbi:MAG: carboxypeptidase-like regulatory domain-containing protein [Cyclobacteriaceae bacterium]